MCGKWSIYCKYRLTTSVHHAREITSTKSPLYCVRIKNAFFCPVYVFNHGYRQYGRLFLSKTLKLTISAMGIKSYFCSLTLIYNEVFDFYHHGKWHAWSLLANGGMFPKSIYAYPSCSYHAMYVNMFVFLCALSCMWFCVDIGKYCSHWLSNKMFEFVSLSYMKLLSHCTTYT